MLVLLFLLFLVVPLVELYLIIQVGQAIGALPTIGLLLLDSLIGTWLLRSQGRAVWRRFRSTLGAGQAPAREVLDGVLVIVGGTLLLAPGFVTDLVGILLLLPPTRAVVRRGLLRNARGRLVMAFAEGANRAAPGRASRQAYDVDGTAHDADRDHLRP